MRRMELSCCLGSYLLHAGLALLLLSTTSASSKNISRQKTNRLQSQPKPVPLSNEFDWKLVKEVFQHEQRNTIFSPFSIKLLLTLLYEASGKNSTTKQELSKALAGSDLNKTRLLYQEFLESSTKENSDYDFDLGTRIFMDGSLAYAADNYTELIESCYKTSIEQVEFQDARTTARKINDWCAKITQGHLNDLVDEDDIRNSAMIIANALFLKASWKNSFPDEYTRKRPFHVTEDHSEEVEFMEQTNIYRYLNDWDLQLEVLKLPYKGRHFSLYIVLPYANSSIDNAIEYLDAGNLFKLESNFLREEIVVIIPKFKFEFGVALKSYLQTVGILEVFTDKASLPLLSKNTNGTLEVSKIFQKAGIEVNERGTLAFAATEIQLVNKFGIDEGPVQFEANRPFLFYIKDEDSDALLFVGKVLNPASA
ncbi:serine protease inhibitor 2-like [Sabethes cyaneus]|uniref:serine protease inhibitor 2-like n=1 Tax=Sabethes cyaneus TaxID=53552 RepID=UPI00237E4D0D|nr:serine protease inhibitor 2-like [Sabethes cyaneus]